MKINNLTKKFNDKVVINNLSHQFIDNKFNFIIGESGKGKTTLFNMILSIDNDYSGEIVDNPIKKSIVFQDYRLLEDFKAITNIKLINNTLTNSDIENELSELLLNKNDCYKQVKEYSGGMKARLSIARALNYESDMVLMDEPLKALDEATKDKTIEYIIKKSKNKTVIIITHDLDEIDKFMNYNNISNTEEKNKYILNLNNY